MAKSLKLFQEIEDLERKSQILVHLKDLKGDILVRTKMRTEFHARAESWQPPFRLQAHPQQDVRLGLEVVTVQFDLKGERYFSRTDVAFDDWKFFLVFHNPIYRLQRREHRRYVIPKSMNNRAFLMRTNERVWNEQTELVDISQGGCSLRLSYDALEIPHRAVALLDIQVGENESFMQMGYVCYKKTEKFNGRSVVRMGIQFRPLPSSELILNKVIQSVSTELFESWTMRTR